jgi:hypothetical protein
MYLDKHEIILKYFHYLISQFAQIFIHFWQTLLEIVQKIISSK